MSTAAAEAVNAGAHEATIQLPRWYARVLLDGSTSRATASDDVLQIGPLTVFRPGAGCEVATFGSPQHPSLALFAGYLFDLGVLRVELGVGEDRSIADVVAAGYVRWGADIFNRLDGCYLVAIWSDDEQRLLLGHDGLGRHPVFYARCPDALWFSSNVLALAASGAVSRRPNRMSLALAALTFWPEAGQTFFEQISRLRPGHHLDVTRTTLSERQHWDPLPHDDEPWLDEKDVLEQFEPSLKRAVDRCMALSPQGIMLSGGVDSVTVAALAARSWRARGAPPLVAVSGRTGQPLSYEERMQSSVADVLGMPHLITTTPEWTERQDEIGMSLGDTAELPSPSRIYWVGTYSRFYRWTASQGLSVLLTGAGGDNWLGVAETHAADLLRRLQLIQLTRFMKADIATGGKSVRTTSRQLLWTFGLRPHVDSLWARVAPGQKTRYHQRKWDAHLPDWICPDRTLRQALVDRLVARRTPALTPAGKAPHSYYRQGVRAASNPYMHYENETAHHVEARCGLRLLSPYHDRPLVAFFNRIPPRVLVHGNRYKGLLRPVVAKHLPKLGLENQRKYYAPAEQQRQLESLRQSIRAAMAESSFDTLIQLGILGRDVGKPGFADAAQSRERLVQSFALMSAERWVRHHTEV